MEQLAIQKYLTERWLILATGKKKTIEAYAKGYGAGIHSVDADKLNPEPDSHDPRVAANHKTRTVLDAAIEIREGLNLDDSKRLAVLSADVVSFVGKPGGVNGSIEWQPILKAERNYDIDNPEDVARLKDETKQLVTEPFYALWRTTWHYCEEGDETEKMLVAAFFTFFPNGLDEKKVDNEFEHHLEDVFVCGPRMNLAEEATENQLPVSLHALETIDYPEEGVPISNEQLESFIVDRYLPPQALINWLANPSKVVDMANIMSDHQSLDFNEV